MDKKFYPLLALLLVVLVTFIIIFAFFKPGCNCGSAGASNGSSKTVELKGKNFSCEIADTNEKIVHGLSDRPSLCADCCMLFIYPAPRPQAFWMRDMLFSLDIIYLDENYTVINFKEQAPPCKPGAYCPVYPSSRPSQYIIEVNNGTVAGLGLQPGDKMEIK